MIILKASYKGSVPFSLEIDGKKVTYIDYAGKKTQWFPPESKKVFANLDKEEYAEWSMAKSEEDVYKIIKVDLIKNECIITKENRTDKSIVPVNDTKEMVKNDIV